MTISVLNISSSHKPMDWDFRERKSEASALRECHMSKESLGRACTNVIRNRERKK